MADRYTNTVEPRQFKIFEQRLRNMPMKRSAPYPPHFSVVTQLKRSKMFNQQSRGICKNEIELNPTRRSSFCMGIFYRRDDRRNGDTVRSVNNKQVDATHFYQKMGCCPLRNSGTGVSTPPYCTKPATGEMKEVGKAKSINRKSPRNESFQCKPKTVHVGDTKAWKVAHVTVKTGNAVSASSGSVRTTDSSQRYSNNFNPQLTSTPQRFAHATSSVTPSADSAKPDSYNFKGDGRDLKQLSYMVEKEIKDGLLKVLSSSDITVALRNLSGSPGLENSRRQSGSSPTHSAKLCNNNPANATRKYADKLGQKKRKQSAIARIGVPKATSSPIMIPKKCRRLAGRKGPAANREYSMNEESSLFSASSCQVTGLWRPWIKA